MPNIHKNLILLYVLESTPYIHKNFILLYMLEDMSLWYNKYALVNYRLSIVYTEESTMANNSNSDAIINEIKKVIHGKDAVIKLN